jgi:hypothetical protein
MALTDNQLTDVFKNQFGRNPLPSETSKYSGADLGALSSMSDPTFALVPGKDGGASTVYNKTTNQAYATPHDFARDVGVDPSQLDWSKFKFDTAYQPGQQPYTEPTPEDPAKTPFDATTAYSDAYTKLGGDTAKTAYTTAQSQISQIDSQMESLFQEKLNQAHQSGGIVSENQLREEVSNENQHLMLQKSALTRQLQTAQSAYNGVIKQAQTQAQLAENTYKDKIAAFNASTRNSFNLANLAQRSSYQTGQLNAKDASLAEKTQHDQETAAIAAAKAGLNAPGISPPAVGTTGGDCGVYVHTLVDVPSMGDSLKAKQQFVNTNGVKASEWAQNPQVGDVLIFNIGKNGHAAVVTQVNNGKVTVTESNYKLDGKVGTRTLNVNDPTIYGAVHGNPKASGADDAAIKSWVDNVKNGNATMSQVPASIRTKVSEGLDSQDGGSFSPLAVSRFTTGANKIVANFIQLPQYTLTANGLPYLQRIDAAMKTPGSISDQDLLDSLTKLNTAGNAISDAQVRLITDGQSFADMRNAFGNKFKNGGVLSDNQRQQIQTIAKAIFDNYKKGYQPVYDQATAQLKASGIPKQFWTIPDLNNLSNEAQGNTSSSSGGGFNANDYRNKYNY